MRDVSGAPSAPSSSSGDTAGTVDSFSGGVLTLKLNDGSTVSGKVTDATEMECMSSSTTSGDQSRGSDDDQSSDQSGGDRSGGDQSGGDQSSGDRSSGGDNPGDQGDQGDQGDGDHGDQSSACSSTALAPGTVVRSAELKISSAGAVWDKLELVTQ